MSDPMRTRALRRISAGRDGRAGLYGRRFGPAAEADLLAYAATRDDEEILAWRDTGPAILRWIRDHQQVEPTNTYTAPAPSEPASSVLAEVLKRGWHVEVLWNGAAGWFTARLIYPGGNLALGDRNMTVAASGATPAEAIARLEEAVLEWA